MSKFCFTFMLVCLWLVSACTAAPEGVSVVETRPSATAVPATPTSTVDSLINSLAEAGGSVVNNGRQPEQGLFPTADVSLWRLSVNGINVNVFEFTTIDERQTIMSNISPSGYEYLTADGKTQTVWDGEGTPWFWAMDNLILNYWGDDTAVITLINGAIGQPFAGSSQPFRPEAGSGAIAGTGEHGISFQYDPYLAANLTSEVVAGRTAQESDGFGFDVMPDHIAFTFLNSYADNWDIYHQTVNIPNQPQILIFPLTAYTEMNETAKAQIAQLQDILRDRPDLPNGALPHLPPPNGQQDLQAQMSYLQFQNGEGIRYLTQFNQELRQINNQEIFYTFQGITADESYYIAAYFPVQTESLPARDSIEDYEAFANNLPTYLAETTAVLNDLPTSAYTPDLGLLDAVIHSLDVAPSLELAPAAELQSEEGCCHPLATMARFVFRRPA